jgi:hypothetical protein
MQVVTLEIADDYYDKFINVIEALPSEKIALHSNKDSMDTEIDNRIDEYMTDKSIALDFSNSINELKLKLQNRQ